ncbi:MAG TPA: hypothetical protein VE130_16280 [Nitrososphaeraceae archaeon]|nr:hypothetical protein [Nitrososphaeraceae archaeon]
MSLKRRLISVDENTYQALRRRGHTGDSFNQVIKLILGPELDSKLLTRNKLYKSVASNKDLSKSTPNSIELEGN